MGGIRTQHARRFRSTWPVELFSRSTWPVEPFCTLPGQNKYYHVFVFHNKHFLSFLYFVFCIFVFLYVVYSVYVRTPAIRNSRVHRLNLSLAFKNFVPPKFWMVSVKKWFSSAPEFAGKSQERAPPKRLFLVKKIPTWVKTSDFWSKMTFWAGRAPGTFL